MNAPPVGGRYRVIRQIGQGGMGRVFEAADLQTNRSVAVKVMIAGNEDALDALLRFYQEGALLSTLKHPNIVAVYGTFLEEETCSIVMELMQGQPLSDVLKAGPLPLGRVQTIARQVAAALGYAHARGIVHRDIKPANVMVLEGDRVKVMDFGVARLLRAGSLLNTSTGMSIGTPLYMAPEQIEGLPIDGRTDIYSLGAVMFQMVTGHPPFEGDDPLTIAFKHVHKPPPFPRTLRLDLPDDWQLLILRCLAKLPEERFQNIGAMEEAIAGLGIGQQVPIVRPPVSPPPASTIVRPPPPTRVAPPAATQPVPMPAPAVGATRLVPVVERPHAEPPAPRPPRRRWLLPVLGIATVTVVAVVAAVLILRSHTTSTTSTATALTSRFVGTLGTTGDAAVQAPQGSAVDSNGNVWVADYGHNRLVELSPKGEAIAFSASGNLDGPAGVTLLSTDDSLTNGVIYVTDSHRGVLKRFASNGGLENHDGVQGSELGEYSGPHGITSDHDGNLYVADFGNNRIQKLIVGASGAEFEEAFGSKGSGPGQFNGPVDVAVDGSGNMYVADFFNSRVQKLSPHGKMLAQFTQFGQHGTESARPHGVAVDADGRIYVADFQNNDIEVLSPRGKPLLRIGGTGSGNGQMVHPAAVALDGNGRLYVADSGNNRIDIFQLSR